MFSTETWAFQRERFLITFTSRHFHCPNISHSLSSLYNKIPRVSELPIMSNPVILRVCSSFICFKCLLLSLLASLEFNSKYYVCRGCLALKGTVYQLRLILMSRLPLILSLFNHRQYRRQRMRSFGMIQQQQQQFIGIPIQMVLPKYRIAKQKFKNETNYNSNKKEK